VVNTHLFFHPYAPHIRTMHTAAILEEASELLTSLQRYSEQAEGVQGPGHSEDGEEQQLRQAASALAGVTPTLLFCGDLNSDLNDGVPGRPFHLVVATHILSCSASCTPCGWATSFWPWHAGGCAAGEVQGSLCALHMQASLSCCRQAS
jgi:hypothetical protein